MSKPSTMALAIGAGYVLGRNRRLRLAALLAVAAATGSAGGLAGRALRGAGGLLSSPQVLDKLPPEATKIADLMRSDLAKAGKSAAQAALSSRIDGWTSALHDQAETVRDGDGRGGRQARGQQDRGQRREDENGDAGPRRSGDGARQRRPAADRSDGRRRGADRQSKAGSARTAGR